jgi:hypothetical protein
MSSQTDWLQHAAPAVLSLLASVIGVPSLLDQVCCFALLTAAMTTRTNSA